MENELRRKVSFSARYKDFKEAYSLYIALPDFTNFTANKLIRRGRKCSRILVLGENKAYVRLSTSQSISCVSRGRFIGKIETV